MKRYFDEKKNHCYVIAEAGLNHNGSIELAKKLIDVAAIAGVDAVKFQKRTVSKLAVKATLDAEDLRFPEFGKTYRDIREYLEFDFNQYVELKNYVKSKGLDFIVTAFDTEAVDFLERVGIDCYKLASHSLTNYDLLEYLAFKRRSVILSTGMADLEEIDAAVKIFKDADCPLSLLHCVSAYPTPLELCNLAMIDILRARYDLPTGYSGHEIGILPSVVAVSRGAEIVERHFTLNKTMVGFDHKISLEPDELISMVRSIRSINQVIGKGEKKVSDIEWVTRRKYHVSMASAVEIKEGDVLIEKMIVYRNPGTGIPQKLAHKVLGKKATRTIPADELLSFDMFV